MFRLERWRQAAWRVDLELRFQNTEHDNVTRGSMMKLMRPQGTFFFKPGSQHQPSSSIVECKHVRIHALEIFHYKRIFQGETNRSCPESETAALAGADEDSEGGVAVEMIDARQLDPANQGLFMLNPE